MAKKKKTTEWSSFDESQFVKLQGIVGSINSARFALENLCQSWRLVPDDVEQAIDLIRESHESLGEIFENLEVQRNEADEE